MDVKGEVLLQLFNKSKLRNGTKIKKIGFSAPLNSMKFCFIVKIFPNLSRNKKELNEIKEEYVDYNADG